MRFIEEELAEGNRSIPFSLASILEEGEELYYETRRHWAILLPFLILGLLLSRATSGLSLLLILSPAFQIKTYDYAITDRRVIARQGMLRPERIEIPLGQIVSVEVAPQPSLLEWLGVGTVCIHTGECSFRFHGIEDGRAFAFYLEKTRRQYSQQK